MPRIILASRSKPRMKLLKQIGLKFIVAPARVKEERTIRRSCADLVIENAMRKAKAVSKKFRSGVVIGADTVVLVGKKIIGKPKNIADACRTLGILSKKPQWVYTGLAVIDIDSGKVFTGYEKTKIYMYRLSNAEIRNYFRKVSPLDKAGSFDVQGFGSMFIDRIEGCFYNVVGLPLAKLSKLLMKAGVDIFK